MRAIIHQDSKPLLVNRPKPEPQQGEALIRVTYAGICATDLEICAGYFGFDGILGHEFVGVVETCPDDECLVSKRVVGDINLACWSPDCYYCGHELHKHCPNRTTLGIDRKDGVMAEFATIPIKNLIFIPDSLPDLSAVFAEPLAAAMEVIKYIPADCRNPVALFGAGRLGYISALYLAVKGVIVHVFDSRKERIDRIESAHENIMRGEPGIQYGVVIDCTGNPLGFSKAIEVVRPGGRLILKSTFAAKLEIDMSMIVVNEITICGTRCGDISAAVEMLCQTLDLSPLLHDPILSLDEFQLGFEIAKTSGEKVVFRM